MRRFHKGDHVRVFDLPGSEWQGQCGTIVEILEYLPCEHAQISQECSVDFAGERRWFLDKHLEKTLSAKDVAVLSR